MFPVNFPEANAEFGPPIGMSEQQVMTVPAYRGTVRRGPVEGLELVVVAWAPSREDLDRLNAGLPIYLTALGGLPPHYLSTDFKAAANPT